LNIKKQLSNRIRGWIPKEPNLPKRQMKATNQTKIHPVNIWNPLWIAPLCITLIFFTINYFLFHIPLISAVIAVAVVDLAVALSIARKQKNRLKIIYLGWIPKEPKPSNAIMAAQAPIMSERDKAIKLKVLSCLLGVLGVLWGWSAAGYAYLYFVGVGVTSYSATVYSVIVCLFVIAIFWLAAFKLKRIQQYFTKEPA
jgi:hypothetical protein